MLHDVAADTQTLLQAALSQHQAGKLREAETLYRNVLLQQPAHADALYYLGMLLYQAGNHSAAADLLAQSVKLDPAHAPRFSDLGVISLDMGRTADAIAAFTMTLKLAPGNFEVQAQLGDLLMQAGDTGAAIAHYQRAVELRPGMAEAHNNLGNLYCMAGRADEAIEACRTAIRLKPDLAEAHNNLGNALKASGDLIAAGKAYESALRLRPNFAEVHNNLGLALSDLRQWEPAQECFHRALAIRPTYAEVHANLGDVARAEGRWDEAIAHYKDTLRHQPDNLIAHWNIGNLHWSAGLHDLAAESYQKALELNPDSSEIHSNFLYAKLYDTNLAPEALLEMHREYARKFEVPLVAQRRPHTNVRDPERRLKVGYVSADFRSHPVAHFIVPIFAHHDKARFELYAYYNDTRNDEFTELLRRHTDHWVPCKDMTDDELAERIRADGVDILIDLAGHTAGNRLLTFARKPAPIQMTYLSYPGTTGLDSMDYRITDRYTDPESHAGHYVEELLHLPNSMWCYTPAPYMPEVTPLPALHNGYVTFGSFNNANKLNDGCLSLWAKILHAVPNSRLLMLTVPEGAVQEKLIEQFAGYGIPADRLELKGKLPGPEFVKWISQADIALDTFPVNGGTTTMEAMWMGVPTVTLIGSRFVARAGYSLLSSVGMAEPAAADTESYLRKARELASDLPTLANMRTNLRRQVAGSPLTEATMFTRNMETCFRETWRKWCIAG